LKDFKFFVDFDLSNHEQKWNFKAYAELAPKIFFGLTPSLREIIFCACSACGKYFFVETQQQKTRLLKGL
jgi:hypothetical protein